MSRPLVAVSVLFALASADIVTVGVLQPQPTADPASRLALITRMATEAKTSKGAQLLVLPEQWASDDTELGGYAALCKSIDVAMTFTYSDGPSSAVALLDTSGGVVLHQKKLQSNSTVPTQLAQTSVVALAFGGVNVNVGVLLGSDRWFMENSRSMMVQGADVLLAPSKDPITDMDLRVLGSRSLTHVVAIATASYAGVGTGRSSIFCACGPASALEHQTWTQSVTGGAVRGAGGCEAPVIMDTSEDASTMPIDLSALVDIRRYNTIQGDVARRPFQYQPMCYPDKRPRTPAPQGSTEALLVKVALLQMAGVNVTTTTSFGTDPVQAHQDKAEQFVRRAATMGADVALMPEMWSVGYGANYPTARAASEPAPESDQQHDSSKLFEWMRYGQGLDGPFIQRMIQLAKELDIAIAAAFLQDIDVVDQFSGQTDHFAPRNAVAVIDRHGDVVYVYAKVHTVFMSPTEVMTTAGRSWYSGDLNLRSGQNVTVGSMICFDREHDEAARGVMLAGAELMLLPTACGLPQYVLDEVSTRAAENAIGIAMTNYASSQEQQWGGNSCAYDHTGELIGIVNATDEQIEIMEFDIASLRAYRQTARGQALTNPLPNPALCQLPKVGSYRPEYPGSGYSTYVRLNNAL
eukprot:TRINITY_DN33216_c0_g1_i2.p1 TRINITY_DN33216_c0_g1~~TRINITY_DN33216_c0_g1_i2.p1  ORF type:complete len:636 (+),score=117.78 TRINITY_DN33216_c0_g1_i2:134-2041(+)